MIARKPFRAVPIRPGARYRARITRTRRPESSIQRLYNTQNPAWCDDAMGVASRDALAAFLKEGPINLTRHGTDRYGRTLALVSVHGRDAGQHLVARGLAHVWR